jgi:ferrous iron transport protein A
MRSARKRTPPILNLDIDATTDALAGAHALSEPAHDAPGLAVVRSVGMNIDDLPEGGIAHVVAIAATTADLDAKLREIGFCEGDEVQLLTRGPFGGQPLAVRLNRRIIAMRGEEARAIEVRPAP